MYGTRCDFVKVGQSAVGKLKRFGKFDEQFLCTSRCGIHQCAPRALCESRIIALGGEVKSNVSKKVNYLLVGGLGSPEWKHGSFGTKVEKAMDLKREGAAICLVCEEYWVSSLSH